MARAADPCIVSSSVVVELPVAQSWELYSNNELLVQWAPSIISVEYDSAILTVGTTRKCTVLVNEKSGYTLEQCTLSDTHKRIDVNVIEESFGFSHMLLSYGFSTLFNADGPNTLITLETHYQAKKIFASVMGSDATAQQLKSVICDNLAGFKHYAELSASTVANKP